MQVRRLLLSFRQHAKPRPEFNRFIRPEHRTRSSREPSLDARVPAIGYCARSQMLMEDMDKKIAGLLGAVATLGAFNAAQAAPTPPGPDRRLAGQFLRSNCWSRSERCSASEGGR